MRIPEEIITKGTYQHQQMHDFVSVKQFIFIRRENKKVLLLRFSNDSDFILNGFEFELTQLNAKGHVIKKIINKISSISEAPGNVFSLSEGIEVDEKCMDFNISIISAFSGEYRYSVIDNEISIFYQPYENNEINKSFAYNYENKGTLHVRSRIKEKYPFAFVVTMITALFLCAVASLAYYYFYLPWG